MICLYGMLFQLYPLPNLNPHHPQFITKSYGTSCLYAQTQATEAHLTLCKGITFSDYLLHAHTNYTFMAIRALKNLSKLKKKCTISSIYLLFANIKRSSR